MMVLIDMDYDKLKNVIEETDVYKIILVRPSDSMPFLTKVGYTVSRKVADISDLSRYQARK